MAETIVVDSHVWVEDSEKAWIDGVVLSIKGEEAKVKTSDGTEVTAKLSKLYPAAEPAYVMTYLSHSFPQHRQYLCAGACLLMQGHPDNINSANLARVLREVSPEEVTANIYTLLDVLLHLVHMDLQQGHSLEVVLTKAEANLAFFFFTHEMLPLDIFLLRFGGDERELEKIWKKKRFGEIIILLYILYFLYNVLYFVENKKY